MTEHEMEKVKEMVREQVVKIQILELSLKSMTSALNNLVESCVSSDGNPVSPGMKNVSIARAYIPPAYDMSYLHKPKPHPLSEG